MYIASRAASLMSAKIESRPRHMYSRSCGRARGPQVHYCKLSKSVNT